MERIDIYDKNGNRTGIVKDRSEPLQDGEYILAVGMWITDKENRILLTQRSLEKRWAPGKWENTAGHVQAGESCEQAIVRELLEETGLAVSQEQLVHLGSAASGRYFGENYGVRLHVPVEDIHFQKGETCGAKWVTFEEFVEMGRGGELSPSVLEHLHGGYKKEFLEFVGHPGSTALDFS